MSRKPQHASYVRLCQVAGDQKPAITTPSGIAKWLNMSPQIIKNWEARGVSKQGALAVEAKTGVPANWVLIGAGNAEQPRLLQEEPAQYAAAPAAAADPLALAPPTISQAVHVLAEAVMHLDPIGRGMAETALASIAKDPAQADRSVKMLELLIGTHTQPPAPPPAPAPKKPKVKQLASERTQNGRANLVLKIGGGEKRQLALPLKTVRDPFDQSSATPRERAWYERLKVAPKAKENPKARDGKQGKASGATKAKK